MRRTDICWLLVLLAGTLLFNPPRLLSQQASAGSPELSDAQMEEFLQNAEIQECKKLAIGVTGSERCSLSDGVLTHDAHSQSIDEYKRHFETAITEEWNFRDSYKYNIAAYRLDRLIGLDMIPVSVERKVKGRTASLTWWVDDVQMMELERRETKMEPPDPPRWNDQMCNARVFNELVYNVDPNLGNLLITKDWNIWLIDFTRAFRMYKKLRNPGGLTRIDRHVYQELDSLSEELLTRELGDVLRKSEIRGLLARRDRIRELFRRRIAEHGERTVLCDMPNR